MPYLLQNSKSNCMSKKAFDKFISKGPTGAKKKEAFRQEKKQIKAELRAEQEARKKDFSKSNESKYGAVTAASKRAAGSDASKEGKGKRAESSRSKPEAGRKKFEERERPAGKFGGERKPEARGKFAGGDKRSTDKRERGDRTDKGSRFDKRDQRNNPSKDPVEGSYSAFRAKGEKAGKANRLVLKKAEKESKITPEEPATDTKKKQLELRSSKPQEATERKSAPKPEATAPKNRSSDKEKVKEKEKEYNADGDLMMPLNKFIAHAGLCGRREAAIMVKDGLVVVNGERILEPGFKVSAADKITVKSKPVFLQKNLVYVLLNKPKDFITTAKDPEGRKTVLELIKGATPERVYPVGRLDRNTTGVLLLTNDGELAQKLTHPSYEIKKIYEVKLDKPVVKKDFEAILNGITLEDGFVQADALAYADAKDKSVIGIQIHSGRNRIVRRIFEHLGYDVRNLDRVMFANLTKKNVDRGKWRLLNEKEIRLLKFMNQSFVRKRDKKDA